MAYVTDGFNRRIDTLRLSVTDLCNERCIYCMPPEGVKKLDHADILTLEELREIAEAAVSLGVEKIRLTGGEPLVRRGVLDLCGALGRIDGLRELCITTNGLLLPDMSGALKAVGVSRVNMSLDTLKPERYKEITRTGTLDEALRGLDAALSHFGFVKLNVVLMGGVNDDEIEDFVALTKSEPLEVRFLELMPMGECAGWHKERFIKADVVLARCPELAPIGRSGVAERFKAPDHRGTVGLIRPLSACFCDTCSRIRVTADGMLKPCLHSDTELPLRGLHGDALKQAIIEGVRMKPVGHSLGARASDTHRSMNEIGG